MLEYICENTKTKVSRLVLFQMLVNQMRFRYCLEDGGFRYSNSQIENTTGVSANSAKKIPVKRFSKVFFTSFTSVFMVYEYLIMSVRTAVSRAFTLPSPLRSELGDISFCFMRFVINALSRAFTLPSKFRSPLR